MWRFAAAAAVAAAAVCTAGVAGQGGLPSTSVQSGEFQHSKAIGGTATYYWTLDTAAGTLSSALEITGATGWMAFGYQSSMANSDVTLGYYDEAATTWTVLDAQVSGVGLAPTIDAVQNIVDYGGAQVGNVQTMRWIRNLDTGDSNDFTLVQPGDRTTQFDVIVAYHTSSDNWNNSHTSRFNLQTAPNPAQVPFFTEFCSADCGLGTCNTAAVPPVCVCSAANTESTPAGGCRCQAGFIDQGVGGCVASSLSIDEELPQKSDVDLGDLSLTWKLDDDRITFRLVLSGGGWAAIGFGKGMSDADVYTGSDAGVSDQQASGQFQPQNDQIDNVLDYRTKTEGGDLIVVFSRLLDTGDATDVVISSEDTDTDVIFAYSSQSDTALKHDQTHAVSINFVTGGSVNLAIPHAILMSLAWGLFVVAANFLAAFFKGIGHAWFIAHAALNTTAIIFTIIGFILAVILVDQDFGQGGVAQVHSILGLIVLIFSVFQAVLGVLADKLWSPDRDGVPVFPDKIHQWLGRFTLLCAIVTMYLGNAAINGGIVWYIVLSVYFLIVVVAYIALTVKGVGETH